MIKQNQKILNSMLVVTDALCILASLILAWIIRFKSDIMYIEGGYLAFNNYLKPVILIIPVYLIIYNFFNLYTPYRIRSVFDEFLNLLKANILGILIFTLILYLTKEMNYSRYLLFIFSILSIVISTIERAVIRFILRYLRKNGKNLKHILIVGYSDLTEEFLHRIHSHKQWGYNVIGILDDNLYVNKDKVYSKITDKNNELKKAVEEAAASTASGEKIIGKINALDKHLAKKNIDEVFVTLSLKEYEKLGSIIETCEKNGIRTQIIPDYYKYIPARPYVEEIEGLPVINTRYIPLDNLFNKFMKRVFDIAVSMACIVLFSPIMFITTMIIKLTSPGPIIFNQDRIGLNNKKFVMYKFRSMHIQKEDEEKVCWTTENDPRKTKFGNFIRKTSIDELPQLFNVLKGDMSLVGPRPERPYFVGKFKEEIPKYMVKHQVRPGISGWAQVNGLRGDTSISKRIEYDIYYIENWRMGLDIKILWLTLFKGFVNKNAY
ncbi:undecaprenyl-phosphate glucose phosphotransferase [Clostridium aestuarii]|uniref:Undecaprenyl-phosphate glucose phosphotransferase n=1 Tax=Clostridium aestuarii TaxID=338193 RepID=A0ABT4CZV7_9CLOT|nr:undecaprenyl-phosphate glucose phosphotransferase [Clostridium aestuarii]MCY6484521.1 undecaprenyl-phosphate glucose phosphotransferase [Clostridium aestuarii]